MYRVEWIGMMSIYVFAAFCFFLVDSDCVASRMPVRVATTFETPIVSLGMYLKEFDEVCRRRELPRKLSSSPALTIVAASF